MKNIVENQGIKTDKPLPMSYEALKAERDAQQKRADALEIRLRNALTSEQEAIQRAHAANQTADALAVENAALTRERSELSAIGELIRTQDNRITDQPFFAVMTKREIVASEDHDCDRICWVENQSGDYVEATETQHRRLEAIYQAKYEVRDGWDRYAMKEIDVFVTGCFTEQGCKDYINKNGHNLNKPFIYAFGSYRNDEYQTVRKFIMQMPETPATDAALASIQAQGVEKALAVVSACRENICPGGLSENRQYEESIVQPHLDGIADELGNLIIELREAK